MKSKKKIFIILSIITSLVIVMSIIIVVILSKKSNDPEPSFKRTIKYELNPGNNIYISAWNDPYQRYEICDVDIDGRVNTNYSYLYTSFNSKVSLSDIINSNKDVSVNSSAHRKNLSSVVKYLHY